LGGSYITLSQEKRGFYQSRVRKREGEKDFWWGEENGSAGCPEVALVLDCSTMKKKKCCWGGEKLGEIKGGVSNIRNARNPFLSGDTTA